MRPDRTASRDFQQVVAPKQVPARPAPEGRGSGVRVLRISAMAGLVLAVGPRHLPALTGLKYAHSLAVANAMEFSIRELEVQVLKQDRTRPLLAFEHNRILRLLARKGAEALEDLIARHAAPIFFDQVRQQLCLTR
jgi:hypothetical protein